MDYESFMLNQSIAELSKLHSEIRMEKEPLLRKLIKGEPISEKEDGFLSGLAKVEELIANRKQQLQEQSEENDD